MRGASRIDWPLNSRLRSRSLPGKARKPTSFAVTVFRFRPRSTPVTNCSATAGSLRAGFGAAWPESHERARLLELADCSFPGRRAGPIRSLLCRVAVAYIRRCSARARPPAAAGDGSNLRSWHCRRDAADRARRWLARAVARRAAPRRLLCGRTVLGATRAPGALRPAVGAAVSNAAPSRFWIDARRHLCPGPDGRSRKLLLRARAGRRGRPICPRLLRDRGAGAWPRVRLWHGLPALGGCAGLESSPPGFAWLRITNGPHPASGLVAAVD